MRGGVGPDGKSEDLGESRDLRSRGRGIQYGGSSLGAPAGIQRLLGAVPVVGDGPDNPRTGRRERSPARQGRAGMGLGVGGAAAAAGARERGGAGWLTLRDPGGRGSMARGGGPGRGTRTWPGQAGRGRGAGCPGGSGLCGRAGSGEGEAAPARTGARPRGGAEGGPRTGAGIGSQTDERVGARAKRGGGGVPVQTFVPGKTLSWRGGAWPGDGALIRCPRLPPLGTLDGSSVSTNPIDDPVSLAWTFLLSFIPSSLTLTTLLTASLPSSQTTLPLLPLHPLHTALLPLLHVTSPTREAKPNLGTRVSGTALSVTPLNGGPRGAVGRSDLRLGTSSLTSSHLLPSPATCWRTRFPKRLCFVHLLPSGGRLGAALGDDGQEAEDPSPLPQTPHSLWTRPRIPTLPSLDLSPSHPISSRPER